MLRLDPREERIRSARRFEVSEGGGEYNVGRAVRTVFGVPVRLLTAWVDNPVGRLLESLVLASGVDTRDVIWRDPAVPGVRNGLNFTERGFGVRAPVGVSDREFSAAAQLGRTDFDWPAVFAPGRTAWFHTGGIFAGLSPDTAALTLDGLDAARQAGVVTSVDLNHRPSIFRDDVDGARAGSTFEALVRRADVVFAGVADLTGRLGLGTGTDGSFPALATQLLDKFPEVRTVVASDRRVRSASRHEWRVLGLDRDKGVLGSRDYDLEVLDRIGGGDAMAAGVIATLLRGGDPQDAIECGAAAGALAMTTPGDQLVADAAEVARVASGTPPVAVR
ncbi:sugar kinase [Amycolatopsis acidicola]|uniref:Sugar kinase n=2 Tax=Amycolatopsis acidicola TaxID=2596893 RepID=A0A5N0V0L1_9PSEU|nr:sugar kinase [Amycolatopsis acidicola]